MEYYFDEVYKKKIVYDMKDMLVSPVFHHLGIVISLEGGVVLNHVVGSVRQSVAKDFGSPL